ncbi:MAG: hypothetical protein R3B09_32715 [Nannocystaceae bacterium]
MGIAVDDDLGVGPQPLAPDAGEEEEVDPGGVALLAEATADPREVLRLAEAAGEVGLGGDEEGPLDPRIIDVGAGDEDARVGRVGVEELGEAGRIDAAFDEGAEVPGDAVGGGGLLVEEDEESVGEARRQRPAIDRLEGPPEEAEAILGAQRRTKDLGERREGGLELASEGPSCRGYACLRRGVTWGELLRLRLSFTRLGNLSDRVLSSFADAASARGLRQDKG